MDQVASGLTSGALEDAIAAECSTARRVKTAQTNPLGLVSGTTAEGRVRNGINLRQP